MPVLPHHRITAEGRQHGTLAILSRRRPILPLFSGSKPTTPASAYTATSPQDYAGHPPWERVRSPPTPGGPPIYVPGAQAAASAISSFSAVPPFLFPLSDSGLSRPPAAASPPQRQVRVSSASAAGGEVDEQPRIR